MNIFEKIVNGFQPPIIFANSFIIDIRQGSTYTSDYGQTQKQSSKDIQKILKTLICTLKINEKLLILTWNNVLHSFVRKNVFYSKNIQYAYNFYGTDQNICRGVFRNQSNIYGGASSSLQKSQKIILSYHLQDFIKKLHVLLERSCSVKRAEQSLTTKKVLKKLKH